MKKRVVQALGCILAMTMVVGSLTACGGKSEKKAENLVLNIRLLSRQQVYHRHWNH